MKRLFLARSAKACWRDPELSDFERELCKKGRKRTRAVGSFLMLKGVQPDLMLSSCALRAQQTSEIFAQALLYEGRIHYLKEFYQSPVSRMMDMLRAQPEEVTDLFVVAHSPQIRELLHRVTGQALARFPRSGVVTVTLPFSRWELLEERKGAIDSLVDPKFFSHYMPASLRPL